MVEATSVKITLAQKVGPRWRVSAQVDPLGVPVSSEGSGPHTFETTGRQQRSHTAHSYVTATTR